MLEVEGLHACLQDYQNIFPFMHLDFSSSLAVFHTFCCNLHAVMRLDHKSAHEILEQITP